MKIYIFPLTVLLQSEVLPVREIPRMMK